MTIPECLQYTVGFMKASGGREELPLKFRSTQIQVGSEVGPLCRRQDVVKDPVWVHSPVLSDTFDVVRNVYS